MTKMAKQKGLLITDRSKTFPSCIKVDFFFLFTTEALYVSTPLFLGKQSASLASAGGFPWKTTCIRSTRFQSALLYSHGPFYI